jgi:hypothetical protein
MLDRQVVEEFIDERFNGEYFDMPADIGKGALVETFCLYVEDDYYEWLVDNYKSFFNHGSPDWDWIRDRMGHYGQK